MNSAMVLLEYEHPGGGVKVLVSQRCTCSNRVVTISESTKDSAYSAHASKVDEV